MLALCIESSHARGMGHLFRALALADGLREHNVDLIFLLNQHQPALKLIASRGYDSEIVPLERPGEWEKDIVRKRNIRLWVNDRLNTDARHAACVTEAGIPLVTFDDRGSGAPYADINVAALIFDEAGALKGKRVLQGPDYLVINPEIRDFQRVRTNQTSLLVTLGGSDTYGVTLSVIRHLVKIGKAATVVVGPGFARMDELKELLTPEFPLKQGVPSLIKEFSLHDLAVTGGGVTPFEAAASGLPTIVIANERFEVAVGQALENFGVSRYAGHHDDIDWSLFDIILPIETMSRRGIEKIGLHGRQRVITAIMELRCQS